MATSLIGSLPIYAQHLSEQTGVQVLVQGTRAYTDGKKICVPFTEDDLQLSFGYIAHEASHVRNTDMAIFESTCREPFRKNLLNILEDIRIERLSMDEYPGTEDDIRYLNRKVLLDPFEPQHVEQAPPVHIIHNALLFGAYWKLQEPQLEVPAKAYLEALETLLGKETADKIMAEALKTLKCSSTDEVLQLVDSIIALLPNQDEQQPQPDSEPDGEDEGEGQEGEGDGESESTPEGGGEGTPAEAGNSNQAGEGGPEENPQPQQSGKGDGESSGSNSDGEAEGQGQPDTHADSSPDGQGDSPDQKEGGQQASGSQSRGAGESATQGLREQVLQATEKDLEGLISEVGDAAAQLLDQKAQREYHPYKPFPLAGRSGRRSAEAAQRRKLLGEEHSAGLKQILNGLLQAKVDCRVRLKRQGRRIDTSRIAMIPAGETRLFRSKARAERQSAAVQFLFDKSASMSCAMDQAEAALYAVLKGMEGLPLVTTGAMSFPGSNTQGECCDLIKRSTERLNAAFEAGGFGSLDAGGTPLAQAIWPAAVEVLRAKGERKILFVITDGSPTCGSEDYCKEMFERCEASGIEVIGLGFGDANSYVLGKLFKKHVAVGTVSKLKTALFEVVRDSLTR